MNTEKPLTKSILWLALATGLLLLISFIAMQFTEEVVWTLSDFIFSGTLIFGTSLAYKLITKKSGEIVYRVAIGFALFTGFFLIWVNAAVGIIGFEDNPINLLYFGVIFVEMIGAVIARSAQRIGTHYVCYGNLPSINCCNCSYRRFLSISTKHCIPYHRSEWVFYYALCRSSTAV